MKLPTTTRARLNLYRQRANDSIWAKDWKLHKYGNTWRTEWQSGIREDGTILTDNRDTLGDYLGDWTGFDSWMRREATGFYIDDFYSETIRGGVVRLRSARFTLYIPCTYCTGWDGATLYYAMAERVKRGAPEDDHEAAIIEAARTAYGRAEREAEIAREDFARERAADDIHDSRAEIHDINKRARALLAEIRGQEFTENVCAALRHRLDEYLHDRRKCFEKIKERQENFWSALSY